MIASALWGNAGEFAASRHGVLTRSQAAHNNISAKVIARLIRHGLLLEPAPGVLVVSGSPPTWRQALTVATVARGTSAAGFRSAAALQQADGYREGPLELLVRVAQRAQQGVRQHEGPMCPDDIVEVDGIRCTNIARTLCDLGSVDSPQQVQQAFEWAWRAGVSRVWIRAAAERLHRPGQRGTGVILQLLDRADRQQGPTESALEVRVERALAGIPGLVRQHVVLSPAGAFVARVDFAIPHVRVAIEAHSRRHHFGLDAPDADANREAALQNEDWIVRYVTDSQARSAAKLHASVAALIAARWPKS